MNINKHLQLSIITTTLILSIGIFFVFFSPKLPISQPITKAQSSYVPIGEGCTNAYYIDKDCDGYGVASPLGVDADDNDPEVNTPETVIAKYGNLTNFLHYLGYYPDRIFYIATDGNDNTGKANDINNPYKTWGAIKPQLQPGDAVIFRGGTYDYLGNYAITCSYLDGTADKPIIIMAYPGENVIIDATNPISIGYLNYSIFDGFILDNTQGSGWGNGIGGSYSTHITFRNIESKGHSSGFHFMQDLHNILTENCVFHDNSHSHGVYWGSREYPNSNLTIKNCIIYRNGLHGFQHNGRVTNLVLENNIIHSNSLGGVSLLEGVSNSTFRNNLIFSNNAQGVIFYLYDSTMSTIQPYDQKNNLFVNNLIWVGKYKWKGDGTDPSDHAPVHFNDGTAAQDKSMDENVFRNNILISYHGPVFRFDQKKFADTTIIENNVIYRVGGSDKVMTYGGDTYDFDAFKSFSSLIKNNVFQDPKLIDISIDYYSTPEKFNFNYLSDSPAIDFGTTTEETPSTDLRGNSRVGNVDAGCYEYLPQNLTILTSTLPEGVVNQSYSATIQSFGGTPPYTYSITSGSLPLNLNLNSDGVISGKPIQSGNYNFTIKVTDSSNNEDTKEFALIVNDEQTQPLTITTEDLPEGTVDVEYSAALSASGGTTPYTWSKVSGNLPNGLSLNSSAGTISGTPTTQGTFNFTVQVKDNENNTATKSLSITINPPDTTSPTRSNGSPTGELPAGTTQITLSLTTNENAICRYSTTPNIPYSKMTNTFSNTGKTSHSTTITGLSSSNTYNYYIKCIDTSGNANTDDYAISFSIASPGEVTTVVSKIKPDCTGESGLCFTSLAAWEKARQGDITASGRNTIEVAECYPMVDTIPVVINGWKTDANHYIKIYTPETARHNGIAGTGYRLDITNGDYVIYIRESHVKIFGLELTGSETEYGFYTAEYENIDDIELAYNLIHGLGGTNSNSAGIYITSGSHYISNLKFYNNIIYNIGGPGFWSKSNNTSNSGNVFNNTIFKCNKSNSSYRAGIRDQSGQFTFKNNASFDNGYKDYYSSEATQNGGSNNASSDSTGNTGLQNLSSADQFVNTTEGSEDLHLKSGSDLIDAGTDLSSYFTDDIDGQSRTGAWDIGADERSKSVFLKGDLNQDNKVDSKDFQILIQKFKQTEDIENEDLNSDGIVDVKDIGVMMHYWKE